MSSRRRGKSAHLCIESLETRINPYTVNDSSDLAAANPTKSPETANHTITLRSVFNYSMSAKKAIAVDFASGMTINLGTVIFTTQSVKLTGQRDGNGPTVIVEGGGLVVGKGSVVKDIQIEHAPGVGLIVNANSTVQGCVLNANGGAGLELQGNNCKVKGNLIGVKPDGVTPDGNVMGIILVHSSNDLIGGTNAADRNIISASTGDAFNGGNGIYLSPFSSAVSNNNRIYNNYIGTDISGTIALPNATDGVVLVGTGNSLGGPGKNMGNLIVASKGATGSAGYTAVQIAGTSNNSVMGNLIGTKPDGVSMFSDGNNPPEVEFGIFAIGYGGRNTTISKNVIADALVGIEMSGGGDAGHTRIVGNMIGVGQDGATPLRNQDGLALYGTTGVQVGGPSTADMNIISGNSRDGIELASAANDNKIQGNYIGTNPAKSEDIGNGRYGIEIEGNNNKIGDTLATGTANKRLGNTIAFNGPDDMNTGVHGYGVYVDWGTGNTIRGNSIYENESLNIYFNRGSGFEFPLNDIGTLKTVGVGKNARSEFDTFPDNDSGPNNLQNYPEVRSVASGGTYVFELNSTPNTLFTIDFYSAHQLTHSGFGDAESYIASITKKTDALGHLEVTLRTADSRICATATDEFGNTSELSPVDTDADGIADSWEASDMGIDIDDDGTVDLKLGQNYGAGPQHKDLFVEIDVASNSPYNGITTSQIMNGAGSLIGLFQAFGNCAGQRSEQPRRHCWRVAAHQLGDFDRRARYRDVEWLRQPQAEQCLFERSKAEIGLGARQPVRDCRHCLQPGGRRYQLLRHFGADPSGFRRQIARLWWK